MEGDDSLDGEGGDDDVNGNQGNDTVRGGAGADWVRGGQGDDSVDGGEAREIPAADTDAALRAALERLQRLSGVA
jgi:hypothetical protein